MIWEYWFGIFNYNMNGVNISPANITTNTTTTIEPNINNNMIRLSIFPNSKANLLGLSVDPIDEDKGEGLCVSKIKNGGLCSGFGVQKGMILSFIQNTSYDIHANYQKMVDHLRASIKECIQQNDIQNDSKSLLLGFTYHSIPRLLPLDQIGGYTYDLIIYLYPSGQVQLGLELVACNKKNEEGCLVQKIAQDKLCGLKNIQKGMILSLIQNTHYDAKSNYDKVVADLVDNKIACAKQNDVLNHSAVLRLGFVRSSGNKRLLNKKIDGTTAMFKNKNNNNEVVENKNSNKQIVENNEKENNIDDDERREEEGIDDDDDKEEEEEEKEETTEILNVVKKRKHSKLRPVAPRTGFQLFASEMRDQVWDEYDTENKKYETVLVRSDMTIPIAVAEKINEQWNQLPESMHKTWNACARNEIIIKVYPSKGTIGLEVNTCKPKENLGCVVDQVLENKACWGKNIKKGMILSMIQNSRYDVNSDFDMIVRKLKDEIERCEDIPAGENANGDKIIRLGFIAKPNLTYNELKALKYKSFSTALGMKTSLLKDIKLLSDRSLQLKNTWDTLEPDMSNHFGNDDAIKITSINEIMKKLNEVNAEVDKLLNNVKDSDVKESRTYKRMMNGEIAELPDGGISNRRSKLILELQKGAHASGVMSTKSKETSSEEESSSEEEESSSSEDDGDSSYEEESSSEESSSEDERETTRRKKALVAKRKAATLAKKKKAAAARAAKKRKIAAAKRDKKAALYRSNSISNISPRSGKKQYRKKQQKRKKVRLGGHYQVEPDKIPNIIIDSSSTDASNKYLMKVKNLEKDRLLWSVEDAKEVLGNRWEELVDNYLKEAAEKIGGTIEYQLDLLAKANYNILEVFNLAVGVSHTKNNGIKRLFTADEKEKFYDAVMKEGTDFYKIHHDYLSEIKIVDLVEYYYLYFIQSEQGEYFKANYVPKKVNPYDEEDEYNDSCEVCGSGGNLLCCESGSCRLVYHMQCLDPPLHVIPEGTWFCPMCTKKTAKNNDCTNGSSSMMNLHEEITSNKYSNYDAEKAMMNSNNIKQASKSLKEDSVQDEQINDISEQTGKNLNPDNDAGISITKNATNDSTTNDIRRRAEQSDDSSTSSASSSVDDDILPLRKENPIGITHNNPIVIIDDDSTTGPNDDTNNDDDRNKIIGNKRKLDSISVDINANVDINNTSDYENNTRRNKPNPVPEIMLV